ncbi:serine carboxypeptidase-like 7 isoform X1 [Corylus avellana]|uniref:serine carboxypeptidase-like 7 isoform X1 n=1 Tax=Corylus avellana TaxID=13451 RepID=UPI00286AC3AE|nr:serine carboxypeptidase-like 7 isoform X1 [Corylus avellana]
MAAATYFRFVCFQLILLMLLPNPAVPFSIIKSLPGFSGSLPFKLETGYIGVGEKEDVQFFYYFIESEGNPREDPLMLWFTGGPGCSAISGLAFEIGPLQFNLVEYNGSLPTLALNPYSWTKVASIIFVDSPVGTGFSYSTSMEGSKSSDTIHANRGYDFLRKWLLSHPNFIANPLYIGGESYCGMLVPIIVQKISNGIEAGYKPLLNLKGYVLGNPATDRKFDDHSKVPFAHRMAIIPDELYKKAKRSCKGEYIEIDPSNIQCSNDLQAISKCTEGLNHAHILEPRCPPQFHPLNKIAENRRYLIERYGESYKPEFHQFGCRNYNDFLCNIWANNKSVQRALYVRKGTIGVWIRCNKHLPYQKDVESTVSYHFYLNSKGYRALIYSGDHDMYIPYLGTQLWIKSLNLSIVDEWRPWLVDLQVAGFTRGYSNHLTYATVKGGGHTAPEYRPKECYAMFKRWTSQAPL